LELFFLAEIVMSIPEPGLQLVPAASGITTDQVPLPHCWYEVPLTQLNRPSEVQAVPAGFAVPEPEFVLAGAVAAAAAGEVVVAASDGEVEVVAGTGTTIAVLTLVAANTPASVVVVGTTGAGVVVGVVTTAAGGAVVVGTATGDAAELAPPLTEVPSRFAMVSGLQLLAPVDHPVNLFATSLA
jgi:hypothetical protein